MARFWAEESFRKDSERSRVIRNLRDGRWWIRTTDFCLVSPLRQAAQTTSCSGPEPTITRMNTGGSRHLRRVSGLLDVGSVKRRLHTLQGSIATGAATASRAPAGLYPQQTEGGSPSEKRQQTTIHSIGTTSRLVSPAVSVLGLILQTQPPIGGLRNRATALDYPYQSRSSRKSASRSSLSPNRL